MNKVEFVVSSILLGFAVIVLRKPFARSIIEWQNRFWGFNFGERRVKISEYVIIVVGTSLIILGLLVLFGVGSTKHS